MPFLILFDMKNNAFRFAVRLLLIAVPFLISCSCEKTNADSGNPTISIASHNSGDDTVLAPGKSMTFQVECKSNGQDAITNFIAANNGVRLVDEGFFKQDYVRQLVFTKDTASQNVLVFTIRDKSGKSTSATYNINKAEGPAGELQFVKDVMIGAQESTAKGSFMNVKSGAIFTKGEAAAIQANIHFLCYYSTVDSDEMVIASPGANVDATIYGAGGPTDWSVKNTTRFVPITLSVDQFNAFTKVDELISLYSDVAGKRKAKNLAVGNAFSFKQEELGLYGVFIVKAVTGSVTGGVTVDMVIQKMKKR